jgi:hypothetical protein
MARSETTSLFIDDVIRFGVVAATTGAVILAPSIMIALDKPLSKLLTHLNRRDDELSRQREVKRVISYMKSQGYLAGDYEHGLQVTAKAKKRLASREAALTAQPPAVWDKKWRIIMYDIPNTHTSARHEIRRKLRAYGCFHLQRSVLITPFACFDDVAHLRPYLRRRKIRHVFRNQHARQRQTVAATFCTKISRNAFQITGTYVHVICRFVLAGNCLKVTSSRLLNRSAVVANSSVVAH